MALAARCPACTTVFRVVPDQLKLAGGWVRCGRCGEVFHALDAAVETGTEPPPATTESRAEVISAVAEAEAEPVADAAADADAETRAPDEPDRANPPPDPADPPVTPPIVVARSEAEARVAEPPDPGPDSAPVPPWPDLDLRADRAEAPMTFDAPGFARPPPPRQGWEQPRLRTTLMLLATASAVLLVAQVALHHRADIELQWPAAGDWFEPGCARGGCGERAPRRLKSLVVESSSLSDSETPPGYRLSLLLRNNSGGEIRMPALDLSLTDLQGQLIARRVLHPAEMGARQASLPAHAELPLQAWLDTGERRVAGYTIEVFYP